MKFASLRAQWKYWLSGLLVALLGLALARGVAPRCEGRAAEILRSAGKLTAIAGLILIAIGINRRVAAAEKETP